MSTDQRTWHGIYELKIVIYCSQYELNTRLDEMTEMK